MTETRHAPPGDPHIAEGPHSEINQSTVSRLPVSQNVTLTDGSDGTDLELRGVTTGLIEAISFDQCGLQIHYYNSVPHPRPR